MNLIANLRMAVLEPLHTDCLCQIILNAKQGHYVHPTRTTQKRGSKVQASRMVSRRIPTPEPLHTNCLLLISLR
jgi:hypothetical protein